MPIYEYECTSCHHHFDLMQKISDAPTKQCPQCFENTAVRLVSAAGFQLKGSGWYATDFKNKGKPAPTKEGTGDNSSAGGEKTGGESAKTTAGDSSKSKGESD